jgi:hypothetical protein
VLLPHSCFTANNSELSTVAIKLYPENKRKRFVEMKINTAVNTDKTG